MRAPFFPHLRREELLEFNVLYACCVRVLSALPSLILCNSNLCLIHVYATEFKNMWNCVTTVITICGTEFDTLLTVF